MKKKTLKEKHDFIVLFSQIYELMHLKEIHSAFSQCNNSGVWFFK